MICEFCYNLDKMMYKIFFLGRIFVSGLLLYLYTETKKPLKIFKNLKKPKIAKKTWVFSNPVSHSSN